MLAQPIKISPRLCPADWREAARQTYTDAFRRLVDGEPEVDIWGEVALAVAVLAIRAADNSVED
jgi:hypothetical protein